jgi:hypothetical protein
MQKRTDELTGRRDFDVVPSPVRPAVLTSISTSINGLVDDFFASFTNRFNIFAGTLNGVTCRREQRRRQQYYSSNFTHLNLLIVQASRTDLRVEHQAVVNVPEFGAGLYRPVAGLANRLNVLAQTLDRVAGR